MKRVIVFGLVFLLAFGNVLAQQAPVTFTSSTTLVIIDVTVKDKAGKIVEDLKKGDFSLSEDGKTAADRGLRFPEARYRSGAPVPAVKPANETKPAPEPKLRRLPLLPG